MQTSGRGLSLASKHTHTERSNLSIPFRSVSPHKDSYCLKVKEGQRSPEHEDYWPKNKTKEG